MFLFPQPEKRNADGLFAHRRSDWAPIVARASYRRNLCGFGAHVRQDLSCRCEACVTGEITVVTVEMNKNCGKSADIVLGVGIDDYYLLCW